jgi:hypothetical protein
MKTTTIILAAALLGAACESEPPAPAMPTWVDDVEPIVHGNCFHCHGSNHIDPTALRWDFYELNAMATGFGIDPAEFAVVPPGLPGARSHVILWIPYINLTNDGRMPPPPGPPLRPREIQVIKNWMAAGTPRGMRANNNKPSAAWLARPSTINVADADGEQVLGKVTCAGMASAPILHSGVTKLPDGWTPPCTLDLYDGQDLVTVNLN